MDGWQGESLTGAGSRGRRTLGATLTSTGLHLALLLVIGWLLSASKTPAADPPRVELRHVVFLDQNGPGGGGGGRSAPAPPRRLEVPPATPPAPTPVVTPPLVTPPPTPQLVAPITTNAELLQSSGRSTFSLGTEPGGDGRGRGAGDGDGPGAGPGRNGGTGGGPFGLGTGVVWPTLLISQEPKYTSRAMQAKVQGIAEVEAVVLPNGTVGDVRIVKSLDSAFGLDDEAIKCARLWLFRPGRDREGRAVSAVVRIQLEFVLR